MQSAEETVEAYLASLPKDRQKELARLRVLIKKHLPKGFEEGMQFGMIGYYIPLSKYPNTYNNQPLGYIAMASQKNYISLYLMSVYGENEEQFRSEYKKTGKKLNMGKSCVRFKKFDDLPQELIAKTIASMTPEQFIQRYEAAHA
jgi:hypothetical protein